MSAFIIIFYENKSAPKRVSFIIIYERDNKIIKYWYWI